MRIGSDKVSTYVKELLNKSRAEQLLLQENLGGVVATTPENIHYVLGIPLRTTNWDMQIYALLPREKNKKIALILPSNRLGVLAQRGIPDVNIYLHSPFYLQGTTEGNETTDDIERLVGLLAVNTTFYDSPVTALLAAIHDSGLEHQDLAVDEMRFNPSLLEELKMRFEKKIYNGYRILRDIRLVKTEEEIHRLEEVAILNEVAENQMINMIKEGVHEVKLAQRYREFMVENGAVPGMVAVGGGPRSALPLIEEYFYEFKSKDLVRFDLCTQLNGYWGDTGRTAVIGEPSEWQNRKFDAIQSGWAHALTLMRPGMKLLDVFNETVDTVRKNGIPTYQRQHIGHSIGLEIYDDMVISGKDERIIEKDMIFCVEVPYYELGKGGFQIEDTIVITENGYRFLTNMERKLYVR